MADGSAVVVIGGVPQTASGGVLARGTAVVSTGHVHQLSIQYWPGDTVYDRDGQTYVVLSFQYTGGEVYYTCEDYAGRHVFTLEDINGWRGLPPMPAPQAGPPGRVVPGGRQVPVPGVVRVPAAITVPQQVPQGNFPVYPGKRLVKV
jgi:hypothetical protein